MAEKMRRFIPSDRIPVTVDVFIPFSKSSEFLKWYEKEINFFPLWCVPYRPAHYYEWISDAFPKDDELYLDLAIYGLKKNDEKNYYRMIEEELMRVGGLKTLISTNYYSEDEFWRIWNKENYISVKKRTDPDNIFRDLYSKTCLASRGIGR
jgi:hypothetical protein